MRHANTVFKSVMGCAWKHVIRHAQLLEVPQALELRRVNDLHHVRREVDVSVNGVIERFTRPQTGRCHACPVRWEKKTKPFFSDRGVSGTSGPNCFKYRKPSQPWPQLRSLRSNARSRVPRKFSTRRCYRSGCWRPLRSAQQLENLCTWRMHFVHLFSRFLKFMAGWVFRIGRAARFHASRRLLRRPSRLL